MLKTPKCVICDLDNTLYDWVSFFVPSFYAMIDKAVDILNCNRETLLDEFQAVHQKHYDSEHPFSLLETETVKKEIHNYGKQYMLEMLDPAFHAYNSMRKRLLSTYPHVYETLDILIANDISLIAHTESQLYAVVDRLQRLNLTHYFVKIYCRQRPKTYHPGGISDSMWLAEFPENKICELSHHQRKPDPRVLYEICADSGLLPEETAYIGDSIARDVMMAKRAKLFAIWAAYGTHHDPKLYEGLVRISHWTEKDIRREEKLARAAKTVKPNFVARHNFSDILTVFKLDAADPMKRSAS